MPTTPDPAEPSRSRRFPRPGGIWFVVAIVLFVAAAGGAAYVSTRDVSTSSTDDGDALASEAEPEAVEASASPAPPLYTDPESYLGQDLHIVATVQHVVDGNSFRVIPGPDANPEPSLLVAYLGFPVVEAGATLELEGTLTAFAPDEVEEALGSQLSAPTFQASTDEYVFAARTIKNLNGQPEEPTEVAQQPDVSAAPAADPVVTAPTGSSSAVAAPPPAAPSATGGGTSSGGGDPNGGSSASGSGSGTSSRPKPGNSNDPKPVVTYTGDESGQYGDDATFEARVTSGNEPIRDAKVVFELRAGDSSRKFSGRTDRNGVAVATGELIHEPGTREMVATYRVDGKRKVTDSTTFVVEKEDTSLELTTDEANGSDESSEEEGSEQGNNGKGKTRLVAVLSEGEGQVLEGQTVNFFAGGEFLGSAVTDSSGVATFEVPPRDDKESSFEARFDGTDYFLTSEDVASAGD